MERQRPTRGATVWFAAREVAQHSLLRETVDADGAARIALRVRAALAKWNGSSYGLLRVIAVSFFAEGVATAGWTVVAVLVGVTACVVTGAFAAAPVVPVGVLPVLLTAIALLPGAAAVADVGFVAAGL